MPATRRRTTVRPANRGNLRAPLCRIPVSDVQCSVGLLVLSALLMLPGLIMIIYASGFESAGGGARASTSNGGDPNAPPETIYFDSAIDAFNTYSAGFESCADELDAAIVGVGNIPIEGVTTTSFNIDAALVELIPQPPYNFVQKQIRIRGFYGGLRANAGEDVVLNLGDPSESSTIGNTTLHIDFKKSAPQGIYPFFCNGLSGCEMSPEAASTLSYCQMVRNGVGEYVVDESKIMPTASSNDEESSSNSNSTPTPAPTPYMCEYNELCGYCYEYEYRRCMGVILRPRVSGEGEVTSNALPKQWVAVATGGLNTETGEVDGYGPYLEDLCFDEGPFGEKGAWTLFPQYEYGTYYDPNPQAPPMNESAPAGTNAAALFPAVAKEGYYIKIMIAMHNDLFVSAVNAFGTDLRDDYSNRPPTRPLEDETTTASLPTEAARTDSGGGAVDREGLRIGGIALLSIGGVFLLLGLIIFFYALRGMAARGGASGTVGPQVPEKDEAQIIAVGALVREQHAAVGDFDLDVGHLRGEEDGGTRLTEDDGGGYTMSWHRRPKSNDVPATTVMLESSTPQPRLIVHPFSTGDTYEYPLELPPPPSSVVASVS